MRAVRKTITLTNSLNDGIKEQIGAGYYVDDSEDIRDLIRQEREHNAEPRSSLLIEGENGGERNLLPRPYSRKECGLSMQDLFPSHLTTPPLLASPCMTTWMLHVIRRSSAQRHPVH